MFVISVVSNIVLLLDLCSLYSIGIVHGAAVISENCSVHHANEHILYAVTILLNVACYLVKLNK
jgi:hypothetical protein